jgi:DNA mismatch repair protein MutL
VAVIWIQIPYDQVDVNVHPTKHEVRFAQQNKVHKVVADAVAKALTDIQRTRWYGDSKTSPIISSYGKVAEQNTQFTGKPRRTKDEASKHPLPASIDPSRATFEKVEAMAEKNEVPRREIHENYISSVAEEKSLPLKKSTKQPLPKNHPIKKAVQHPIWEKRTFADLKLIGQFHDTYLICEGKDGLVLIDQHAAHERIAYEKLKKSVENQTRTSQRLLLPETIELGFRETQILNRMLPELKQLGLEIEPFGGSTFVVTAVPELLSQRHMGPLIEEMVERIVDVGFGNGLESVLDQCLMIMACHSTIRGNQTLSVQQSQALLEQLDNCEQPSHCPHGRPTWIQWSLKALQKAFNRIVG